MPLPSWLRQGCLARLDTGAPKGQPPQARRTALWAAALLAVCPLFWLSGLRPMSDLPGVTVALVAQVLILQGRSDRRRLIYGALLSGLAAGIRVQTACLTVPLLGLAFVRQRRAGASWLLTRPTAALVAGGVAWAVPLVVDSGGVAGESPRALKAMPASPSPPAAPAATAAGHRLAWSSSTSSLRAR